MTTTSRRLVDYLNSDAAMDVVTAEDTRVTTVRPSDPAEMRNGNGTISTSTILFVAPLEEVPRPPDLVVRATMTVKAVAMRVGPFHITGVMYLRKESTNRIVLLATEQRFIVIADGVLTLANDAEHPLHHGTLFVNTRNVEYICPLEDGNG